MSVFLSSVLMVAMSVLVDGAAPAPGIPEEPLPAHALRRLGTLRFRSGDRIVATTLSADGKQLAVLGVKGISFLDPVTGKERCHTSVSDDASRGAQFEESRARATFTPDGRMLTAVTSVGDFLVWDVATGELLQKWQLPGNVYGQASALRSDGDMVVRIAPEPGTASAVRIWNTISRTEQSHFGLPFRYRPDRHFLTELSPDGRILATWIDYSPDLPARRGAGFGAASLPAAGELQLWAADTGQELLRLRNAEGAFIAAAFSPDSRTLVTRVGQNTIVLWDLATGKERRRFVARAIGDPLRESIGKPGIPNAVLVISPDSKTLASGDRSGVVQTWDLVSGERKGQFQGPGCPVKGLVFLAGNRVLAHGWDGQVTHVWELSDSKPKPVEIGHRDAIAHLVFTQSGQYLHSVSADGTVCTWDTQSGAERGRFVLAGRPDSLQFSPDGHYVCGRSLTRDGYILTEVSTRCEACALESTLFGVLGDAGFSSDAQLVAGGARSSRDGYQIYVWNVRTGETLADLTGPTIGPLAVALASRGRSVAILGQTRTGATVRVWDLLERKDRFTWVGEPVSRPSIVFSPDDRYLVVASGKGTIRLLDAVRGHELCKLGKAEESLTASPVFSPDGRMIAVGSQRGEGGESLMRLWEVASGQVRAEWSGHRGAVTALAFSPDGQVLASGSADTTILLGNVHEAIQPVFPLTTKELDKLWAQLDASDASKAFQALDRLAAAPEESVPYLKRHLHPIEGKRADPVALARLIGELDHEDFSRREQASRNLEQVGLDAEAALRKALQGKLGEESRRRVQALLDRLAEPLPTPDQWRSLRAVEVLERAGTAEARETLATLAAGKSGAPLTREASAARERLGRRQGKP